MPAQTPLPPLPPSKRQNRWFLGEIAIDTRHSTSTAWPSSGPTSENLDDCFVCAHLRPSSNFTTTSSRQTITSPPSHTSAAAAAEQTQPDSTPPRCRAEHTHPPASSQPANNEFGRRRRRLVPAIRRLSNCCERTPQRTRRKPSGNAASIRDSRRGGSHCAPRVKMPTHPAPTLGLN